MIIRRQFGPNNVFQRRIIQASADAPLFRRYLPVVAGDPYRRRLVGFFVPSDHPIIPAGGGISTTAKQNAVTVITG